MYKSVANRDFYFEPTSLVPLKIQGLRPHVIDKIFCKLYNQSMHNSNYAHHLLYFIYFY